MTLTADSDTAWCKSLTHPIQAGVYQLDDQQVRVVRSGSGRFYAVDENGRYQPGLIYRLRTHLESA